MQRSPVSKYFHLGLKKIRDPYRPRSGRAPWEALSLPVLPFASMQPVCPCLLSPGNKVSSYLLLVLVLLVSLAFLVESQDLWDNKCHLML